jgi:hypothetical protein
MNKRLTIKHQEDILTVNGPEAEVDLLLKWIKDYRHGETFDNSVTCQSSLDLCACKTKALRLNLDIIK